LRFFQGVLEFAQKAPAGGAGLVVEGEGFRGSADGAFVALAGGRYEVRSREVRRVECELACFGGEGVQGGAAHHDHLPDAQGLVRGYVAQHLHAVVHCDGSADAVLVQDRRLVGDPRVQLPDGDEVAFDPAAAALVHAEYRLRAVVLLQAVRVAVVAAVDPVRYLLEPVVPPIGEVV